MVTPWRINTLGKSIKNAPQTLREAKFGRICGNESRSRGSLKWDLEGNNKKYIYTKKGVKKRTQSFRDGPSLWEIEMLAWFLNNQRETCLNFIALFGFRVHKNR